MQTDRQLLTQVEQHQRLDEWNDAKADNPRGQCIHYLLEAWAKRTPNAIAIAAPGRAPLTYGRLYSQLSSIVKILNTSGVGRNDRVAMVLPSGPGMAVAFLTVAAGATCTPS